MFDLCFFFTPATSVTMKDISFYSRVEVRTTRDQIYGILRFSALAGCHFHQIADSAHAEPA